MLTRQSSTTEQTAVAREGTAKAQQELSADVQSLSEALYDLSTWYHIGIFVLLVATLIFVDVWILFDVQDASHVLLATGVNIALLACFHRANDPRGAHRHGVS